MWIILKCKNCCLNKSDRINLVAGGIALASPLNSLFAFTRWQHSSDGLVACLGCRFDPQISHCHCGQESLSNSALIIVSIVCNDQMLNKMVSLVQSVTAYMPQVVGC